MRHKIFIESKEIFIDRDHNFWKSLWSDKEVALIPIVRSNFISYKISYMYSLFIMIKGKEGFRHTWFHHERDAEGCTISRTSELRERIFLSIHQVLFFILRGDERPLREMVIVVVGGEGTLLMVYIASRNPSSTHHRSMPLIYNTSSTRVMSPTF